MVIKTILLSTALKNALTHAKNGRVGLLARGGHHQKVTLGPPGLLDHSPLRKAGTDGEK